MGGPKGVLWPFRRLYLPISHAPALLILLQGPPSRDGVRVQLQNHPLSRLGLGITLLTRPRPPANYLGVVIITIMFSPLSKAATLAFLASSAYALPSLLVFSATTGFRHESIPTAIEVLRSAASAQNVSFEFTECVSQPHRIWILELIGKRCRAVHDGFIGSI